jgi:hypothetical protein
MRQILNTGVRPRTDIPQAIAIVCPLVGDGGRTKRRKEPRRLHDIPHDFQQQILTETDLRLFEKFVWQKQATEWMRGAYPTPGNNLACNTTEAITVYVKPGARRSYGPVIRDANGVMSPKRLTEHSDLTQQVWWIMPAHQPQARRQSSSPIPGAIAGAPDQAVHVRPSVRKIARASGN